MYIEKHKKNHVILNGGRNSQALKMQFLTFFPTLEAFTLCILRNFSSGFRNTIV